MSATLVVRPKVNEYATWWPVHDGPEPQHSGVAGPPQIEILTVA